MRKIKCSWYLFTKRIREQIVENGFISMTVCGLMVIAADFATI
jgi:hypothetical protein